MSMNTQFALGVHVLTLLAAAAPTSLPSEALAGSANANPVQVRRALGRFRQAGFVGSRPGAGGGSHLLQDPATITLADIWRVVNRENPVLGSYPGDPHCPVGQRIQSWVSDIDRQARHAIQAELAKITIFQLVDEAHSGGHRRAPSDPADR